MSNQPYTYIKLQPERYIFTSLGKKQIKKVVDFVPLGMNNIVNMGFGDLQSDGSVDDKVNSNNGDIIKLLSTLVAILDNFTKEYPGIEVFFEGSTIERTKLYSRILKTYYSTFSRNFNITAIVRSENKNRRILFYPKADLDYLGFLIKRIR